MAFIGNAGQYNQLAQTTMGSMGANLKKAQESRELLSEQLAPPDNEKVKEGVFSGQATAGLAKVVKGSKDVISKVQAGKKAISDAQDTVSALTSKAKNAVSSVSDAVSGGAKPPPIQPRSAVNTPQGIEKPSPLATNRTPGNLPANAKQNLLDTAQSHDDALSQMSDGDKATTMAKMEADPIAGQNFKASGMAYNDRVSVLNQRTGIIGDAIDDINGRAATQTASTVTRGLVPNVGNNGMRVGQSLTGEGNQAVNGALDQLNGNLRSAANSVAGQAKGALADSANNIHGALQAGADTAGQVGEDIASGVSKAQGVVDAGISTAGTVLDALGPIGDILGVGMTIFGGIEDAITHHKAAEQAKEAEATMKQPIANATPAAQTTTATLDTSKISQASASAHF